MVWVRERDGQKSGRKQKTRGNRVDLWVGERKEKSQRRLKNKEE